MWVRDCTLLAPTVLTSLLRFPRYGIIAFGIKQLQFFLDFVFLRAERLSYLFSLTKEKFQMKKSLMFWFQHLIIGRILYYIEQKYANRWTDGQTYRQTDPEKDMYGWMDEQNDRQKDK